MKTTSLIFSLLLTNSANAGLNWVRGTFWQTVYENELHLAVTGVSSELKEECRYFENLAADPSNSSYLEKSDFEDLDKGTLPSDMLNPQFVMDFQIEIKPDLISLQNLSKRTDVVGFINSGKASDILPNYTQLPEEMRLVRSAFQGPAQTSVAAMSLTAIGTKLGVAKSFPEIKTDGKRHFLRMRSKSLACDFISNRLKLSVQSQAEVKIALESQITNQKYYDTVEEISEGVIKQSKSSQIRAALFGFKLAKSLLAEENTNSEIIEKRMVDTLKLVFNVEQMEKSNVWTSGISKSVLSVSGTSTPVSVTVNLNYVSGGVK